MTKEELFQNALFNLTRLHDGEVESLHKKDFQDVSGKAIRDVSEVIAVLLKLDLIETEDAPDIYFLTPEAYDLLEGSEAYDLLWNELGLEFVETPERKRGLSYQLIGEEKPTEKTPFLGKSSRIAIGALLAGVISLIYAIIPLDPPKTEKKNMSPEELRGLDDATILQNGDTLNLEEKRELME